MLSPSQSSAGTPTLLSFYPWLLEQERDFSTLLSFIVTVRDRLAAVINSSSKKDLLLAYLAPFVTVCRFYQETFFPLLEGATPLSLDAPFKRHERHLYILFRRLQLGEQKFRDRVQRLLSTDEMLAHVVATECKLVSGTWTSLTDILDRVLQRVSFYRDAFSTVMSQEWQPSSEHDDTGAGRRSSTLLVPVIANCRKILFRLITRLERYAAQRRLHMELSKRVINLERPRLLQVDSEQYYSPIRMFSIPRRLSQASSKSRTQSPANLKGSASTGSGSGIGAASKSHSQSQSQSHSGSSLASSSSRCSATLSDTTPCDCYPSALSDEEELSTNRVLFNAMVRKEALWYRLLILTPTRLVLARPRGIANNIAAFFSDPIGCNDFEVIEVVEPLTMFAKGLQGLRTDDPDEREYLMPTGKTLQFEGPAEFAGFVAALREAILELATASLTGR